MYANQSSHSPWDLIQTAAGQTFTTSDGLQVHVNIGPHGAIHGFADPAFQDSFDEKVRAFNGPLASSKTGTIDRCGWPMLNASAAPDDLQYTRRTTAMVEDFSNGLTPETMNVALVKGCCKPSPEGRYGANIVSGWRWWCPVLCFCVCMCLCA